jgi:hypothetical protein
MKYTQQVSISYSMFAERKNRSNPVFFFLIFNKIRTIKFILMETITISYRNSHDVLTKEEILLLHIFEYGGPGIHEEPIEFWEPRRPSADELEDELPF